MVWKASLQPRKEGELGHGGTACVSSIQDAGQGGCEFQVSLSYIVGPCLTQTETSTPKQKPKCHVFIYQTDRSYLSQKIWQLPAAPAPSHSTGRGDHRLLHPISASCTPSLCRGSTISIALLLTLSLSWLLFLPVSLPPESSVASPTLT